MALEREEGEDRPLFSLVDKSAGAEHKVSILASSEEQKTLWTTHVHNMLDMQGNFLRGKTTTTTLCRASLRSQQVNKCIYM